MSNLLGYTKRVLTTILATALVLTAMPANVFASEIEDADPVAIEVQENENAVEAGEETFLEEEPVAEEPAQASEDDQVLTDEFLEGEKVITFNATGVGITDVTNATKDGETGVWTWTTAATDITFKVKAEAHYSFDLATEGKGSLQVTTGDEVLVIEPTGDAESGFTVTIPAEKVTGNAAFNVVATGVENPKYTVTFNGDSKVKFGYASDAIDNVYNPNPKEGEEKVVPELYAGDYIYFKVVETPENTRIATNAAGKEYVDVTKFGIPEELVIDDGGYFKYQISEPVSGQEGDPAAYVNVRTVETQEVEFVNEDEKVKSFKFYYLKHPTEESDEWVIDGAPVTVTFEDEDEEVVIDKYRTIRIYEDDFTYVDEEKDFTIVKSVGTAPRYIDDNRANYELNINNKLGEEVAIVTGNLEAPETATNPAEDAVTITKVTGTTVKYPDDETGKFYVKNSGGYKFTAVTEAAGKEIAGVKYTIGETEADAIKTSVDNEYLIPEAAIGDAIRAGGLTLTATLEDAAVTTKTVTINKPTGLATVKIWNYLPTVDENGKIIGYTQTDDTYVPETGEGYLKGEIVTFDGEATTATYKINKKQVVAITVEGAAGESGKNDKYIVLDDAVAVGGVFVEAEPSTALEPVKGKYVVKANTDRTFDITTHEVVGISTVEAMGKNFASEKDDKALTATVLGDGGTESGVKAEGSKVVKGNADVTFTVGLASGAYADILEPEVKAGEYTLEAKESAGTYTVSAKDINAAIATGEAITVTAKATAKEMVKAEFAVPEGVASITVSKQKGSPETVTVVSGKATLDLEKGEKIKVTGISQSVSDFDAVTLYNVEGKEGYSDTAYDLGAVNADAKFTITATNFEINDTPFKTEVIKPEGTPSSVAVAHEIDATGWSETIGTKSYLKAAYLLKDSLPVKETLSGTAGLVQKYRIKGAAKYKVEVDSSTTITGNLTGSVEGDVGKFNIPATAFKAAAVNGKPLTVVVEIAEDGFNNLTATHEGDAGVKAVEYRIGGKKTDENALEYGKNIDVNVISKDGFAVSEVYFGTASAMAAAKSKAAEPSNPASVRTYLESLTDKQLTEAKITKLDETSEFTIAQIQNDYEIWSITKPVYWMQVTEKDISITVIDNKGTFDQPYNNESFISLKKGGELEKLNDSSKWTVTATVPGAKKTDTPVDVKSKVLEPYNTDELKFKKQDETDIQGKTVTVKIESVEKVDDKPVASYELTFNVSKKLEDGSISFGDPAPASLALQLGKAEQVKVDLKNGATADMYKVLFSKNSGDVSYEKFFDVTENADGFTIKAKVAKADDVIGKNDITIQLVDVNADASYFTATLPVTVNAVDNVKTANLGAVEATGTQDSIKVDLSKVSGLEGFQATDNLFFYIVATKTAGDSDKFVTTVTKTVPVSNSVVDLVVAPDEEAFLVADPQTYKVEVTLVQLKDGEDHYTGDVDLAYTDSKSATSTKNDVKTVVGGTFATSIKFVKNKDVNVYGTKTIYNTMKDDINIGHVEYTLKGEKTGPSVKRLSYVVIKNKAGEIVADATSTIENGVYFDENSNIFITPADFAEEPGNYTLYAYAVEPKGYEVTAKTTIAIKQGIEDLAISAPSDTIYKAPGKKATLKATALYFPQKGITKKVIWSLTDQLGEEFNYPGISINKSGVITVDKDAPIPDDGIFVAANAADYIGDYDVPGYGRFTLEPINIVGESDPISYVTVTNDDGSVTELEEGGKYLSSEINGYFTAYDKTGDLINKVKFAASGITSSKDAFSKIVRGAQATKPVIKNASVTVTKTDGFKESKKIKFEVVSDKGLRAIVLDDNGREMMTETTGKGNYEVDNDFASGKVLALRVYGTNNALIDHKIAVKGASKKAYNKQTGFTLYALTPNKDVTTVTLTEKANGEVTTITIKNNKIGAKTAAPKITAENFVDSSFKGNSFIAKDNKGKIFSHLEFDTDNAYKAAGSYNKVTYTVKDAKAGEKVRISTAVLNLANVFEGNAKINPLISKVAPGEYDVTLGAGGKFEIDYQDVVETATPGVYSGTGTFDIKKGTYKFTVTKIDATSAALTKPATVKVTAAPAPKANVAAAVTTFNTLTKDMPIGFKTMNNIVFNEQLGVTSTTANYVNLVGINDKGTINKFGSMFKADSIPAADRTSPNMTAKFKVLNNGDYDAKKGIQGYALVEWQNLDGSVGSKWVKLTVKGELPVPTP